MSDAMVRVAPRPATTAEVARVHADAQLDLVRGASDAGGTWIDADTSTSAASYEAALLAVGAGLTAVASLEAGEGDSAFCAVRPPGHHATPPPAMGFCLFNTVAVTAAALPERGQRLRIVEARE